MGEAQDRQRKTMTPESQRIAIAEACGWTKCQPDQHYGHDRPKGIKPHGKEQHAGDWEWLPDYLNDLNAMHEAEKALTPQQQSEYSFGVSKGWLSDRRDNWRGCHATATQRAEAFLRTLGLWKDDK